MNSDLAVLLLFVMLAASMAVFAARPQSRVIDSNIAARSASILIGRWLRNWLVWLVAPLERVLVAASVSPTALNVCGALFGGAAGIAFFFGNLTAAGVLVLIGGLADVMDGRVARARSVADARGAFLDSTFDRFSESFTFTGLILLYAPNARMLLLAAAALGGSMLVSYTRARGEGLGISVSSGVMQRAERLVLLGLGAICDPLLSGRWGIGPGQTMTFVLVVIAAGSYGTAIYRTVTIARALRRIPPQTD